MLASLGEQRRRRSAGDAVIINLSDLDPLRLRYLERLYDHEQIAPPGEAMDSAPFLIEECGLSLAAALQLTRALDGLGLVNECNGLAQPSAWLADGGREAVRALRAARADPIRRAAAARRAALAHAYEARLNGIDGVSAVSAAACDTHGHFLAGPLTERDILRAVDYLEQRRLLKVDVRNAGGDAQTVWITAEGEDCMEQHDGDVGEYLRNQRSNATTYNIGGGSNVQIGNGTNTQNIAMDPAALQGLVDLLRQQLASFGDAESEATAAVDEVAEEAATAHPDRGRVVGALTKLAELAVPAGARLAGEFIRYKLQEWGALPPTASLPPRP
jgi:hypothetical protein